MTGKTEDDKGEEPNKALEDNLTKLTQAIGALAQNQQDLQGNFNEIVQKLDGLGKNDKDELEEDNDHTPGLADADLEALDRKGFLDVILSQVNKSLEGVQTKLESTVGGLRDDLSTKDLKKALTQAASKYKDFKDWGKEIKQLSEENPTLSVERLYKLARVENPDRAKELDEKYAEPDKDDTGNKKTIGGFGGLTPTSGAIDEKPENMDMKQASEAAWSEVFQDES